MIKIKSNRKLDSESKESHTTLRVEIDHRILLWVIPSYEFTGRGHSKVLDLPNDLFKELGIDRGGLDKSIPCPGDASWIILRKYFGLIQ
jgi:hypothetical protein